MILDVLLEFLSPFIPLPQRTGTVFVAISMFVCGTAFLLIAVLFAIHMTSIREAALPLAIFLPLSIASYWFLYRAIRELRRPKSEA